MSVRPPPTPGDRGDVNIFPMKLGGILIHKEFISHLEISESENPQDVRSLRLRMRPLDSIYCVPGKRKVEATFPRQVPEALGGHGSHPFPLAPRARGEGAGRMASA